MDSNLSLSTPDAFPVFPYDKPYDIQLSLMQHLYGAIEDKAVAVVESPTGTGKTASLLSATISWLLDDHERAKKGRLTDCLATDDPNDWVALQTLDRRRRELDAEEAEYRERLFRARRREEAMKRIASGRVVKRQKLSHPDGKYIPDEDAFLPDDSTGQEAEDNIDPKVKALMQRLANHGTSRPSAEEPTCTKVYYASRTHSQLAQVIGELHHLRIFNATPQTSDEADERTSTVRVVSLGSRKQLCINKPLIESSGDLDEKCRELLAGKPGSGCRFLPPREDETQLLEFRDQILAIPKDIEDLAISGKLVNVCPYFASRKAIKQAQLVALPYNLLLSGVARKALGIDVTNQIIVIDEAHNLVSTLLSLSSVVLGSSVIRVSISQLDAYLSKFRLRLSHDHLLYLEKLRVSLNAIRQFIVEWEKGTPGHGAPNLRPTEVMSTRAFVGKMGKNIEGINFLDIKSYLEDSKIARKIASYSDDQTKKGVTPPLHAVESFLLALASPSDDGCIILSAESRDRVEIKYQQLNPASHFRELADAARCMILAGGTMSPIPAMTNQLFPDVDIKRIRPFSCGHIIPPANVLAVVVQKGPRGGQMEFKFQNREDGALFDELGQLLVNLVNVVPAGVVIFFSSYHVLDTVRKLWMADKTLEKIGMRKKVFYEPTETAEVERVLRDYAKEIQQYRGSGKCNGAILMAVVGAKLSEGLNFADDLARAVVMVGLPYPNASSPELKERLKYVSNLSKQKGEKEDAGKELYENLCMNAVNQSIGRAIRHQKDWSSLVLVDTRYSSPRIQRKLPNWILPGVKITSTFGATMKALGEFYKGKR
ncbi:helicase C-terminal domain-containing protein [Thelephora terrestris]|uniref:ATP-dependent DNA helicase CHL1 n=1 Tax=Thelephora terrestris TaxID=56493 RepID=A0A9P6H3J0_9AGAM|nr:helicase C-terminal domain-containing protein [Thelephora terrestris]